jgi:hypothetical protein
MNTKGKYEKKGAERMVFQYASLVGNQYRDTGVWEGILYFFCLFLN